MDNTDKNTIKDFLRKTKSETIETKDVIVEQTSNDDIFVQETSIELVPTKKIKTSVNEEKLKEIIIPIIKNDKEFYLSIKGKNGTKGRDGKSPKIDTIISVLLDGLSNNSKYLELIKGKDSPQLEELTKNLILELKKDKEFLTLIKGENGVDGWSMGGGLGEKDVNRLIDQKLMAINVSYDNSNSSLSATNIQESTDELDEIILSVSADVDGRMNWRNTWGYNSYSENDVVYDDGWTMVANKATEDRAAPQPNGEPENTFSADVDWTTKDNSSVIVGGHLYDFKQSGWIKELKVWVPTLSSSTHYRFIIIDETDTFSPIYNIIENPILNENNWTTIAVGERIVTIGTKLRVLIDALNSGASTNVTGGWLYEGTSNSAPSTSACNRRTQNNIVRIDKTDLNGTTRTSELLSVVPDSTIRIAQTSNLNNYLDYTVLDSPTDLGTYIQYDTLLVDEGISEPIIGTTTIDIDIPIAQATDYVEFENHWTSATLDFADTSGTLEYDGVSQAGSEDNAYGIDIKFQEAYVSPDWDVLAHSSLISTTKDPVIKSNILFITPYGIDSSASNGTRDNPYKTIEYALSIINDNSQNNRYVIQVDPGTYVENNPLQMKPYVNIIGHASNSSIIAAQNNDTLIEMDDAVLISNIGLMGHVSATTINANTSGFMALNIVAIFSGLVGIHVSANDLEFNITDLLTIGSGSEILNVKLGKVILRNMYTTSLATYDCGIKVDGPNSILYGYGYIDESESALKSISVTDYATLELKDGRIHGNTTSGSGTTGVYLEDCLVGITDIQYTTCEYGIFIPFNTTQTIANLMSSYFQLCTQDVYILSPNVRLGGGGVSDSDKVFLNPNATVVAAFVDGKPGDEGFTIFGELHVGNPSKGTESCMGEGDSYTKAMMVYTYNSSTLEYVDVSTSARSVDGSTFEFPNTLVDSAIYTASMVSGTDGLPIGHYGLKIKVVSPKNTGTIIQEYWNGSSWLPLNSMVTQGNSPYYPYGKDTVPTSGDFQLRYDAGLAIDSWTANNPMGIDDDYFWVRHIITSALDVSPVFEQFKLHTNRTEVNSDGWVEFYGRARPIGKLPWAMAGLQKAATNPGDGDIYFSDTIDIGYKENAFTASGMRVGFSSTLPLDMDTSTPVKVRVGLRGDTTGDFNYIIRYTYAIPGSPIYSVALDAPTTHPNQKTITSSVALVQDTIGWLEAELDFSNAIARRLGGFPDVIAMSIESDTGSVSTDLIILDAEYTKWSEGGHI